MAKYLDKQKLAILLEAGKQIVAIRNEAMKFTTVDMLDTDAISASFIYEIVSQYDPNYNVNFSRNGEDAKSNDILIENKTTRVKGPLTATGKPRKGAGEDASFQFHADGDLDHPRYIFAAKDKDNLSIVRLYDIRSASNRKIILNHLLVEKQKWYERCELDIKHRKRDLILLPEKLILDKINLPTKLNIDGCVILRD